MIIGELEEPSVDFHLASQDRFQVRGLVIPWGNLDRTLCQIAVLGNNPELFLACERLLTKLVPTLIEFALILVSPILRDVMRRVGCSGRKVDEKGPRRRQQSLLTHP